MGYLVFRPICVVGSDFGLDVFKLFKATYSLRYGYGSIPIDTL